MDFDSEEEKQLFFGGNEEEELLGLGDDFSPIIDLTKREEESLLSDDALAYKRRKVSSPNPSPKSSLLNESGKPSEKSEKPSEKSEMPSEKSEKPLGKPSPLKGTKKLIRPAPGMPLQSKKKRDLSAKPSTSKTSTLPISIPLEILTSSSPTIPEPHDLSENSSTSIGPTMPPSIPMTSTTSTSQKPREFVLKPPTLKLSDSSDTKMSTSGLTMISPLAWSYDSQIASDTIANERTGPNSKLNGPNRNNIPSGKNNSNRNNNQNRNDKNEPRRNGYNNSRGWESSFNRGYNNYKGRGRNFRGNNSSISNNNNSSSSSNYNFSLFTTRKFFNEKNEYKSENDSVFTFSQAPKVLIMKEDLAPFDESELISLRELIEDAILKDMFDSWAPKLEEGSVYFNVACEIICLSMFSASWILSCDLGKLNGKQLRVIRNGDMPHVDFNAVYKGKLRPASDFLNILAKQNPDTELNVQSWFITDSKEQSDGMVWLAVKMSLKSAKCLVETKERVLSFGARSITFHEY